MITRNERNDASKKRINIKVHDHIVNYLLLIIKKNISKRYFIMNIIEG